MTDTILIADGDPAVARFVDVNLRLEGFSIIMVGGGQAALQAAFEQRPAMIILDVAIPEVDGFDVCRRLRADPRTGHIPVIFLTERSMSSDKLDGLAAGADDYVLKPFDPAELVARVRAALRRCGDLRATSPLTGLPGNHRIEQEVARRLTCGRATAVAYADLNDFKAYNDHYGFLRGDQMIDLTANVLAEALDAHAGPDPFLGHVGGDDFVMVFEPAAVEAVCEQIMREFPKWVSELYDPADLARGYLELPDRRGMARRFEIVSIVVGVATTERRHYSDPRQITVVANEMKRFLKRQACGSAYAVDARTDSVTTGQPVR